MVGLKNQNFIVLLKNLILFDFPLFLNLFAMNKLRLSLYTHTASGNPTKPVYGLCWLSLSILEHFFLSPTKKGCKKPGFLHPSSSYIVITYFPDIH